MIEMKEDCSKWWGHSLATKP